MGGFAGVFPDAGVGGAGGGGVGGVVVEEAGGGVEFGGGADEEGPVETVVFVGAVFVDVEGDVEEGGGDWWWGSLEGMRFGWHFCFVNVWCVRCVSEWFEIGREFAGGTARGDYVTCGF